MIGSGFAGLASACCLAQAGWTVTVLEKNAQLGGRARTWEAGGFTFDMGPSWYWMPDVFEEFFARFGKKPSDYYELIRLDPSYRVFFGPFPVGGGTASFAQGGGAGYVPRLEEQTLDIPADREQLKALFESIEPGSGAKLDRFLKQAEFKYRVGMGDYVRRPSLSLFEFVDARLIKESLRLDMLQSMRKHVGAYFRDQRLVQIMEFPVLFLGGTAREIPAMYSLMNYADIVGGTWYPKGGMRHIADAMLSLAQSLGVTLRASEAATKITVENGKAAGVETEEAIYPADVVVAAADYHHAEQELLPPAYRAYNEAYWDKRVMSPSSLLFYLGVNKRLQNLRHHNLFFDEGLEQHANEIYHDPKWPTRPLFYACCPTQTDSTVAPPGCENLFLLMPVAPGLEDSEETRERYYEIMMERLERFTKQSIRDAVVVKRSYAHRDFIADYHSYKGNAYGLANTLNQTAVFKPRLRSPKVSNLFFAGQLTVPGPGVPPSLLSGQIAADVIARGV